jgi:hypothetical protein
MEQDVAPTHGGCNSKHALQVSGEMTRTVHIYIGDGGPMLQFRMLSGTSEWKYFQ